MIKPKTKLILLITIAVIMLFAIFWVTNDLGNKIQDVVRKKWPTKIITQNLCYGTDPCNILHSIVYSGVHNKYLCKFLGGYLTYETVWEYGHSGKVYCYYPHSRYQ